MVHFYLMPDISIFSKNVYIFCFVFVLQRKTESVCFSNGVFMVGCVGNKFSRMLGGPGRQYVIHAHILSMRWAINIIY